MHTIGPHWPVLHVVCISHDPSGSLAFPSVSIRVHLWLGSLFFGAPPWRRNP